MSTLAPCPKCNCEYTYQDGPLIICPECFHEWSPSETGANEAEPEGLVIRDANGNLLADGDSGDRDQRPESQRHFVRGQSRYKGEEYSLGRRRSRHRLQSAEYRIDGVEV